MITRKELLESMNTAGLSNMLSNLQRAMVAAVISNFVKQEPDEPTVQDADGLMLNSVGPAAASAAVDYAITTCKAQGLYSNIQFNGSFVNNHKILTNEPTAQYTDYSSALRQYLLPRSAYLDFDAMVDPRHMINLECGYPKYITPLMYRYLYDRDDVAHRVVDIFPDESWAVEPYVYETDDEEINTAFEEKWEELCIDHMLLQYLYRMDKVCGVGHYGAFFLGIDDGKELDQPIDEPDLLAGKKRSVGKTKREIVYLRPFDEYLSFVQSYETNRSHPRFGLPEFYNLVFIDSTIDAAGASVGTRVNHRVHWSRVIHVADNLHCSLVYGTPRQQPVFNRLLDLRKIKGGSGEMFWKGAFPGINFEVDPRFVADDPQFGEDEKQRFRDEIEQYSNGLKRTLITLGIKANSLAPQVSDPSKHVKVQEEAIANHCGVPFRVWKGSEEGRVASSQDMLTWNKRLGRRNRNFTEPSLIRATADRLIAIGVLPPTKNGKYFVGWGDLNSTTDEDKANLSLKWTQGLTQYVSSGVIHFIEPLDYMTLIMGMKPRDAIRINNAIKASGGYEKMKKVDPSQSGERNGVGKNAVSKGDRSGSSGSRPKKRNSADKKAEGSTG